MKTELYGMTLPELKEAFASIGLKGFRATQVYDWLYAKGVLSFDDMGNVSKTDIYKLRSNFTLLPEHVRIILEQKSQSGDTRKLLLRFADGNCIETVLMKHDYGNSICISCQVGCDMRCAFCASGQNGALRNLTRGEILVQYYLFRKLAGTKSISRIVMMGSGEPLLNYDEVLAALKLLHAPDGLGISYRNMTISSCGIIPGIERLGQEDLPINLAISLHAVKDDVRTRLMPINKAYPFQAVLSAAEEYYKITSRQITYEYILIAGVNDSDDDAQLLSNYLKFKKVSVNLIPINPVGGSGFLRPSEARIEGFLGVLEKNKVNATIRREMGKDISAACGQLRAKFTAAENTKEGKNESSK